MDVSVLPKTYNKLDDNLYFGTIEVPEKPLDEWPEVLRDYNSILKDCIVRDKVIVIPTADQYIIPEYNKFKKLMDGIGGKWNRKQGGFVFDYSPLRLFKHLCMGHLVNIKQMYQYFPTPERVADEMVLNLDITTEGKDICDILEPSCGQGALIDAILRSDSFDTDVCVINYYELQEENRMLLSQKYDETSHEILDMGEDFMEHDDEEPIKYDYIIANPPFTKGQYIDHTLKMYDLLSEGGTMCVIVGTSHEHSSIKKFKQFKKWLTEVDLEDEKRLPSGTFSESGTSVETIMLTIKK